MERNKKNTKIKGKNWKKKATSVKSCFFFLFYFLIAIGKHKAVLLPSKVSNNNIKQIGLKITPPKKKKSE